MLRAALESYVAGKVSMAAVQAVPVPVPVPDGSAVPDAEKEVGASCFIPFHFVPACVCALSILCLLACARFLG